MMRGVLKEKRGERGEELLYKMKAKRDQRNLGRMRMTFVNSCLRKAFSGAK